MATALSTIRLLGRSGRIYAVSCYLNDTTNNLARFDEAKVATAGSADQYVIKENCTLIDIALTSDLATPTHIQVMRNGTPTGDILDATAQLVSVVNRPNPSCPFTTGDKLMLMQVA